MLKVIGMELGLKFFNIIEHLILRYKNKIFFKFQLTIGILNFRNFNYRIIKFLI